MVDLIVTAARVVGPTMVDLIVTVALAVRVRRWLI